MQRTLRIPRSVLAAACFILAAAFATSARAQNYEGLWWNPSESGWGVNITHQGNVLFSDWYTYDIDGTGMWLVMSNGAQIAAGTYSGTLYRTTGPAFDASPWNPGLVGVTAVGSATFTFSDPNNGSFSYTVNGTSQTKAITRQGFSSPTPTCIEGAQPNAALAINYQDLWWNPSESGWSLQVAHQGDIIDATWYTYDATGKGMWLIMPNGAKTGPGTYSGSLYRASGPTFNAYNPALVSVTQVGTMTLTFSNGSTGTMSATVSGSPVTKAITRQVFASPSTVCGFAPSAPVIGGVTAHNGHAWIPYTPGGDGGFPATYTITCNPGGIVATTISSRVVIGGLVSGTSYQCSVTANNAVGPSAASGLVAVTPSAAPDFNADGKSDIILRNSTDASVLQWLMSGASLVQQTTLGSPGTTRQPRFVADFDGDHKADILWEDADGSTWLSLMNGGNVVSDTMLVGAGTGWSVTQVGDFNGDGKADLVWTHTSGAMQVWLMNGATATSFASFVPAGTGWSVIKLADLNGDGMSDIIWQHSDGTVQAWLMNGLTPTSLGSFVGAGSGWTVALAADLDGDGKQDLIWSNTDGSVQAWLMNGLTVTNLAAFVPAGAGYTATNTGDLNGDGTQDILWRYTDGTVIAWLMGPNLAVNQIASFTGTGNQYAITHTRDLDGDGKDDLLWRAPDGTVQAWLMNGLTASSTATLTGPGPYVVVPPMP